MRRIMILVLMILLSATGFAGQRTMYWRDNSAMLSKMIRPSAVYNGWLVGGDRTEVRIDNAGITMWNGISTRFGASMDIAQATPTFSYEYMWGVEGVGLFATGTAGITPRSLLKSTNGITDFAEVLTGIAHATSRALYRVFVDCGHVKIGGVEKRLLLYFEYSGSLCRVWYSAEVNDADAGDAGTWADLFGETCPAIQHFHGGVFVPGVGLFVFTGDNVPDNRCSSILFASSDGEWGGTHTSATPSTTIVTDSTKTTWRGSYTAMIGKTIYNLTDGSSGIITSTGYGNITCSGGLVGGTDPNQTWDTGDVYAVDSDLGELIALPAVWHSTKWGLAADSRAGWGVDYYSKYVIGANSTQWRTVDLVFCDNKSGYFIPDSPPGAGGNSIYKIDFTDTTTASLGGAVSAIKSGGVPGTGWYGASGKNGIAYISTNSMADSAGAGLEIGNDQYVHIYAIDTYTDDYDDVKKIPRSDYVPSIGRLPDASVGFYADHMLEYGGEIWFPLRVANGNRELTGVSYLAMSAYYCGHVDRQQKPETNVITNPNFAVGTDGLTGWVIPFQQLTFQSGGTTEIVATDTVTGATSGATAVVASVGHISGTWAGGNEVGYLNITSPSGEFDFANNEALLVGGVDCATLKGGITFQVIDDPTGGGGKVLRCRFECTDIYSASYLAPFIHWPVASMSEADKRKLYSNIETFSLQFYIKGDVSDADLSTRMFLLPTAASGLLTEATALSTSIATPTPAVVEDVWHFMKVSEYVPNHSTAFYHHVYPHYSKTDGKAGTIYFKDFQLVPGAIPNKYIEKQFPRNISRNKNRTLQNLTAH